MSDEKLDLILTVVSDIKLKVDNLETRFDGLETRFDKLETRFDGLESEFKSFKIYVTDSISALHNRFNVLEKQMIAIGVEVKAEIKAEIQIVGRQIYRLEEEILLNRADTVRNRRKIEEFETRLTRLENHIGIAV